MAETADHPDDHESLLLHRPGAYGGEGVSQERDHQVTGGHHHQHPRPPGAESGEETPERAECLVRPQVDGSLAGEHHPQLPGSDRARDQEHHEADDPPAVRRRPGRLNSGGVGDEQDNRHEDRDHVERGEYLRQDASGNPLRSQLAGIGVGGGHGHSPYLEAGVTSARNAW